MKRGRFSRQRMLVVHGAVALVALLVIWLGKAPDVTTTEAVTDDVAVRPAGQMAAAVGQPPTPRPTQAPAATASSTQAAAADRSPMLVDFAYAQSWRGPQPAAMAAFRDWAERFRASAASDRPALEAEGIELARNRRTGMLELIQSDPERALDVTVPATLRAILPESVLAELESRVSGVGDYVLLPIEPNADGSPPTRFGVDRIVWLDRTSYHAHIYGRRTEQLTQENASLHGIALDGHMAVHQSPLRVLEAGETPAQPIEPREPITGASIASLDASDSLLVEAHGKTWMLASPENALLLAEALDAAEELPGPKVPPLLSADSTGSPIIEEAAATSWTTGVKKVLVIRVDFSDLPGEPKYRSTGRVYTVQDWRNLFENEIAPFYSANSYGAASIEWRVTETVYRMPRPGADYAVGNKFWQLHDDAVTAASIEEPSSFDVVVIAHGWMGEWVPPASGVFQWAGMAELGGTRVWLNGYSTCVFSRMRLGIPTGFRTPTFGSRTMETAFQGTV